MAPKRPAPTELQSNELQMSVHQRLPTISTTAMEAASNQSAINSQRAARNRSAAAITMFQEQQQQQILVKNRTMKSAAMTSSSSMTATSTTTTSSSTSSSSMQSKRMVPMANWQDELMEFSTQISRQTHFALARIANHFRATGMKFDTNFRNHFLYISNNRVVESYDSFLIGLPRDMKCDDYQVQRPNTTNLNARPQIEINQQQSLDQPPVKRKCIENGVIVETINGPAQTKQLTVDKTQRSTARLSKSMSKIGSQISIQKMTSVHSSVNVATPALNTSVPATTTATASASNANQFKIKNVKSLHQPATVITAVTANNPLNSGDPQKTIENGLAPGGSAKKVRVIKTSKIPGRSNGVLVKPVTLVSTAQVVNAQSTPNRPVQTTKKVNFIPEDPLKIDTPTTTAAAAALPELTIEPIISAEIVRPAFVKEVKILQTNSKQLSTSLPLTTVSTAAAAAAATTTMTTTPGRTMITRSRNNTEHPKQLYKCESCAFTTEVEQNLMRHSLLHTGDKPQVCKTCKKRFPRKPLLLAHMREYHHELHSDLAYWDTN